MSGFRTLLNIYFRIYTSKTVFIIIRPFLVFDMFAFIFLSLVEAVSSFLKQHEDKEEIRNTSSPNELPPNEKNIEIDQFNKESEVPLQDTKLPKDDESLKG